MDKILSVDDILSADDTEYKLVPGFKDGESFRIKSITAGDMIEFVESNEGEAKRTAGLRLIVKSLVDGDGKRIMDDTHIALLRKKSQKVTNRLVDEILKLNGLDVKKDAAAKNE